ncbi:MAG: DUF1667 domain-containing protein [Lawsonibacter sp.]
MKKEMICTVCPMGCHITVEGTSEVINCIEGYTCQRGEQYARQEFSHPVRLLTTTVKVSDGRLLPVRSSRPLPKELMMDCMKELKRTVVEAPIKRYDIVLSNICGCGVDIIASGAIS